MSTTNTDVAQVREAWDTYRLRLARKILAELCHEQMVTPQRHDGTDRTYAVRSDDGRTTYTFDAEVLALDSWCIDEASLRRSVDGAGFPLDPVALIVDFAETMGLAGDDLTAYLEEVVNTLALGAGRPAELRVTARDLARGETDPVVAFQSVEAAMTEGHPCFIANAGRIGFSADDLHRYAPEFGPRMRLNWLAVWADDVEFAAMSDVDYDSLLDSQLGAAQRARFDANLIEQGLDPADYRYLPAHPWQWANRAARLFASEVAARRIVDLGPSDDEFQPQQSIRTLFNVTDPSRHYTKVSLSITNMGFTRGMSADYMSTTPLINDWVRSRIGDDEYLRSIGFEVLYEVAAIGYRNPALNAATEPGSEYRKMLAALWRQSPVPLLRDGEELATMAALLHVDHTGAPLIGALIERSGLSPLAWLRRYLQAYLHPIAYLLYAHELKFSPHGENLILILDNGVPGRVILKDIGEEVFILGECDDLPPECARARSEEADETRNLGILSDVFDDFFRPLAALLHGYGLVDDRDFWAEVAASIDAFQAQHPELVDRFTRWDLFAPTFGAIHLNRLQLRNRQRMADHEIPYASMVAAGHDLANPIASASGDQEDQAAPAAGAADRDDLSTTVGAR
ncbi:putative siderophore biosynthesis protein [Gordonia araii NBRC 100433]|uniref:Putative siderophore biosynthesis protein n=1 Tax=Gordonia araii NBRC 100433 TaxID=1073574 RepID=G7GX70_9ACTN|nr:IucA/IucC family siderophore biosynthesis protein [Gordonia araii]NNG98174.1 IucA/IucC family siderophore biosynthesis protein [Gordonia araii NBRC 100433]GAB08195.1 putative siderophore biosynthesis protein [Gordonia araii NBRC 100433]